MPLGIGILCRSCIFIEQSPLNVEYSQYQPAAFTFHNLSWFPIYTGLTCSKVLLNWEMNLWPPGWQIPQKSYTREKKLKAVKQGLDSVTSGQITWREKKKAGYLLQHTMGPRGRRCWTSLAPNLHCGDSNWLNNYWVKDINYLATDSTDTCHFINLREKWLWIIWRPFSSCDIKKASAA